MFIKGGTMSVDMEALNEKALEPPRKRQNEVAPPVAVSPQVHNESEASNGNVAAGPVNQPTLFGSCIKAQNQWQKDEKEKFIELLQRHGRKWEIIAEGLPRRTP